MRKTIYIVEDDPFISEELKLIIESLGYEVIGNSDQEIQATKEILNMKPNLVCLDIDLGDGGNGFNIAKNIVSNTRTSILFITSFFDEITLSQARQYNPKGYIVKPFRDVDIKTNLALAFYEAPIIINSTKEDLFIRKDGEILRINPDNITHLQGEDNYTSVFILDQPRIVTSTTLKKMEEKLESYGFIRVHKSFVVNMKHIQGLNGNTIYLNGESYPIGKAFKQQLLDKITVL
ncbi:MAG: DNA-binding response regulator [Flavobacteriales bacterium]|nr:DNA-binding response regulator [Flavobacteriales bacterium]